MLRHLNLLPGLLLAAAMLTPVAAEPTLSVEQLKSDFQALKLGMLIHHNMETCHGVQWAEGYKEPATLNPGVESIDADAWADAARAAGMTYAVLITKHVSGFCLWDSKCTGYDVMHPACPCKKDLVARFVKRFTSRGFKVGLYYCWRHPGFDAKFKVLPPECDPATANARHSNLLLDVGPDRAGNILPSSIAVLKRFGAATRKH